jgi:hypothetical protein
MTAILSGFLMKTLGKFFGKVINSTITNAIFNSKKHTNNSKKINTHSYSTGYGSNIPIVFGRMKVQGTILWQSEILEHVTTISKFVNLERVEEEKYHYTVSLLIGICQGPVTSIGRTWLNEEPINDLHNFKFYNGSSEQEPDPLIATICGSNNDSPNYKNLAYLVVKDLNLEPFGNEIPHFTFEVHNHSRISDGLEENVQSIVVIPGCGEFVYDTKIQYEKGDSIKAINQNHQAGTADAIVSLEQISQSLPKVEWLAPVVAWFCDNLDIQSCNIKPGIESITKETFPDQWQVSTFTRETAHLITSHNDKANYGGTINDASIIRYLQAIRDKNYKIMFYPMLFVDTENKPWRGRITGHSSYIRRFFQQYRDFIIHYAKLVQGKIDAFLIGSEMEGLTKLQDTDGSFPAVTELKNLAIDVKKILGPDVKISYAANWSEYHSYQGLYNMDELWGSDAIDFIGIDAYFPLSDVKESIYNHKEIIKGWDQGEGFDFFYDGEEKKALIPSIAWKNIAYWWNNYHYNSNGNRTDWIPCSKKIWFTEYGFPSISCSTNQPNVFFDHTSIEASIPRYSNGKVDILAQRKAIEATERRWAESEIVERKFLWCWDARPYPTWPNLADLWADTQNWARGHWINGKTGLLELKEVIQNLWLKANLDLNVLDVTKLEGVVKGLIIDKYLSLRDILSLLKSIYQFDIIEIDDKIHFISRFHNKIQAIIDKDELISTINPEQKDYNDTQTTLTINDERNRLYNITANYFNESLEYNTAIINNQSDKSIELDLNTILSEEDLKTLVQEAIYNLNAKNTNYNFLLPVEKLIKYNIRPGIKITLNKQNLLVDSVKFLSDFVMQINAISYNKLDNNIIGINIQPQMAKNQISQLINLSLFKIIPQNFTENTIKILVGGYNSSWKGCNIFYQNSKESYNNLRIKNGSHFGQIIKYSNMKYYDTIIDRKNYIIVKMYSGQVNNIQEIDLFNSNKNLAIIDNEIIKFQSVERLNHNTFLLKNLLRNIYDSSTTTYNHFTLLEEDKIIIIPSKKNIKIQIQTLFDDHGINYSNIEEYSGKPNGFTQLKPSNIQLKDDKITWITRNITSDLRPQTENMQFYIELLDAFDQILKSDLITENFYYLPHNFYCAKIQIAVYHNNQIVSEKASFIIPTFA